MKLALRIPPSWQPTSTNIPTYIYNNSTYWWNFKIPFAKLSEQVTGTYIFTEGFSF